MWEANIEGLLAKAEGKLKAAANAEARERTMQKRLADEFDPFNPDRPEVEAAVSEGDVEGGDEEEVQPVHMGMETISPKEYALRAKFS